MNRLRSVTAMRLGRRRRRSLAGLETWLVALVAAGIIGLLLQSSVGARTLRLLLPEATAERAEIIPAAAMAPLDISVVDGDTIRIAGEHRAIRLVGFNAPETRDPRCAAEGALGSRATTRLKQLLRSGTVTFTEVPCACRPGTEGTDRCNYGRSCGALAVDGRDVGDVLIAENLAAPFVCGAHSCPRTPRPWCG